MPIRERLSKYIPTGLSRNAMIAIIAGAVFVIGLTIWVLLGPARGLFGSFLEDAADRPEAPDVVQEIAAVDPEIRRLIDLARKLKDEGKLDAAEVEVRTARAKDPGNEEAKALQDEIIELKKTAEKTRMQNAHDEALKLARELLAAGDLDRADEAVDKALKEIPQSEPAANLKAGIAEARARREADARARHEQAGALVAEGRQALGAGEFDVAIGRAEAALKIDPESEAAVSLRDDAVEAKRRADEAAALAARRQQELDASAAEAREKARAFVGIGEIYLNAGDYTRAEENANKALDIDPTSEAAKDLLSRAVTARKQAEAREPVDVGPTYVGTMDRPGTEAVASLRPEVERVLAALDDALEGRDVDALARVLSNRAGGTFSGRSRDEEIANARAFLEIAVDIAIERSSRIEQLSSLDTMPDGTPAGASAISSFRIGYRIGPTRIPPQSYRVKYDFVREGADWRINGVQVQE